MHKELRRYSSIGNKRGILLLCNKILTKSKVSMDSVRTSCSFVNGCEINFNCGILALEAMHIITKNQTHCFIDEPFFSTLSVDKAITKLCEIAFTFLIEEKLINIEFLKFNDQVDLFYIPKRAFSLHSSVFRNLLISLNAITEVNGEFRIAKNYDIFFGDLIQRTTKKLTLKQLQQKLIAEQEIGEKGELFVLHFEKSRKPFSREDKERIRQISHIDVSAGYDIISFHDEVALKHRYIEVKTYRGIPHFYWSANEIDSAKIRGKDYFLYLVNADRILDHSYIPEIIQNPYSAIINSNDWKLTPSSFLVEKINI